MKNQSALAMRLTLHLILVVLGCGLITCESDPEFEAYKKQYGKTYGQQTKGKLGATGASSESQAQKNFKENLAKVKAANADSSKTYKSGRFINNFNSIKKFNNIHSNAIHRDSRGFRHVR